MKWPKPLAYAHPDVISYRPSTGEPPSKSLVTTNPNYFNNPVELFTKEQVEELIQQARQEGFELGRGE